MAAGAAQAEDQSATGTAPATPAAAASNEAGAAQAGDIIVTAQKRAQRIQDVPLAVTVIDGDDAARRGIDSVTSLVDEVPGVSVNYAFGGTNYGLISIRGIGGADDYKDRKSVV